MLPQRVEDDEQRRERDRVSEEQSERQREVRERSGRLTQRRPRRAVRGGRMTPPRAVGSRSERAGSECDGLPYPGCRSTPPWCTVRR